ncbi:hypothetical protein DOY81_015301 [Sarcophaga bullata]|nr:hypothetical protein DOY81_015301 [Sarcophaga bullata]
MSIGVPIKVLHEAEVYRGKLIEAEDKYELPKMTQISCNINRDGRTANLENVYIRGIKNTFPYIAGHVEKCSDVKKQTGRGRGGPPGGGRGGPPGAPGGGRGAWQGGPTGGRGRGGL